MKYEIITKFNDDNELCFVWMDKSDRVVISPYFPDRIQARQWFIENILPHIIDEWDGVERRKENNTTRRSGVDRRGRETMFDRRQKERGRRWSDN